VDSFAISKGKNRVARWCKVREVAVVEHRQGRSFDATPNERRIASPERARKRPTSSPSTAVEHVFAAGFRAKVGPR